jgi:NADPH2:quinone reductase
MRAVRVHELGAAPRIDEIDPPERTEGAAVLEVEAVALNPLDVAIGAGRFYGGSPPLPYVPGSEAVGRVLVGHSAAPGTRAYVFGDGLGIARDGTLAERATVAEERLVPIDDTVPADLAVGCGIAGIAGWLSVTGRARVGSGDRVLVLGATGTVGLVALQAARLAGADRVVAAGRRTELLGRARELGADATVELADRDDLAEALAEACGGGGPTVVVDPLWDGPLATSLAAAAPGARVVHIGQSAGPDATLSSAVVRGKQIDLLGYSNFALPMEKLRAGYLELLEHVVAGRVQIPFEALPLDRVAEAWERQTAGPGTKLVITT